jgi:hypothetical protein
MSTYCKVIAIAMIIWGKAYGVDEYHRGLRTVLVKTDSKGEVNE